MELNNTWVVREQGKGLYFCYGETNSVELGTWVKYSTTRATVFPTKEAAQQIVNHYRQARKKAKEAGGYNYRSIPEPYVTGIPIERPREQGERKQFYHPCWGTITISRCSCTPPQSLFGSNLSHSHFISLSIHRASKQRQLNRDDIYSEEEIIQVEMSEAQFASFVASMGQGMGTPCTIFRFDGYGITQAPTTDMSRTFYQEGKEKLEELLPTLGEATDMTREMLDTSANKTKLKNLAGKLHELESTINDVMPFILAQFAEVMENTVEAAKQEVNAYAHQVNKDLAKLGAATEAYAPVPLLPGGKTEGQDQ
jgi:hypothetical protein